MQAVSFKCRVQILSKTYIHPPQQISVKININIRYIVRKIVPSVDQYKASHNCNSPMYCLPKNIPDFRHGRPCWALPDLSPRPLLLYQECTSLQGQRSLRSTKRYSLSILSAQLLSRIAPSQWLAPQSGTGSHWHCVCTLILV